MISVPPGPPVAVLLAVSRNEKNGETGTPELARETFDVALPPAAKS